jgi:hypothetical protein
MYMRILSPSTRTILNSVAIGVIALIALGTARADVISTQTLSVPVTDTNWNYTYYFNPFNPALGTLESVTVISQGALDDYVLTVTNTDGTNETISSLSAAFQIDLTGPGSLTSVSQVSTATLPPIGSFILSSGASATYTLAPIGGSPVQGNQVTNTFTSSLGAYEGSTQVVFDGSASATYDLNSSSNIKVAAVTDASQTVTLEYDYCPKTPTPEPLSMSLSGIGLVVLSVFGRKRLVRNR